RNSCGYLAVRSLATAKILERLILCVRLRFGRAPAALRHSPVGTIARARTIGTDMPSSLTPKHPTPAPEAEPHETPLLLSVLGPMSARHDGRDLPLGPPRRRALLALL